MRKSILSAILVFVSFAAFGQLSQFRMIGSGSWTTVNDSTFSSTVTIQADLTGNGFLPTGITDTMLLFSQTGQRYRISTATGLTFSSADLTVIELGGDWGMPVGQIMVYEDNNRDAVPNIPFGATGATAKMQEAVDSYNSTLIGKLQNVSPGTYLNPTITVGPSGILSGIVNGSANFGTLESFDTALVFTASKYYQPYSAVDSLIFTADTTNGVYGAFTIARIDFDTVPVLFNGTAFDSVQFYNIASGDTLRGVHMMYFENTPYGVAVSVPTNSRTTQDTLSGGGGSSSPAQNISGLLAEWDGQTGLSSASTTTTWVDQSSFSRSAANTIASRQPTVTANGAEFMDDSNPDALVFSPSVTIPSTYSMTASFTVDDAGRDQMFWGKTGSSGDYIMYRNSGITTNNFHYKTAIWSVPTLTTTAYIAQIACASGSCELWINGTSYGTATAPASTSYDVLGNFSDNSASQSLNGTFHYLSLHSIEYSTQNRTNIYDYINTRFSLGL